MGLEKEVYIEGAFKTSLVGQGLIDGVMMKGPDSICTVIREPNGGLIKKIEDVPAIEKSKITQIPILRGVVLLISTAVANANAFAYSLNLGGEYDKNKNSSEKLIDSILRAFLIIVVFVLTYMCFFILPNTITMNISKFIENRIILTISKEASIIALFIVYIFGFTRIKLIQRVIQYHGAEHKAIHCLENEQEATTDIARKYSRFHQRCGTSFLLIVILAYILVFSMITINSLAIEILIKTILIPVIAGVSYEIMKWVGRDSSRVARTLSYVGLMLQNLITEEPDDSQIEVALEAMMPVVPIEDGKDTW